MNRSFQSVVIAFFASILLISGCSSGSSTGVSFSKVLQDVTEEQCFSEYVSFYGDTQRNFMLTDLSLSIDNEIILTAFSLDTYDYDVFNDPDRPALTQLAASYGLDHYHSHGAKEGRQLPYGCERFLRPNPQCFIDYVFLDPSEYDVSVTLGDLEAVNEMAQIHGRVDELDPFLPVIGFLHWINHGRDEGRAIPTIPGVSCKGMMTHQPACRPGNRFPNCNGGALSAALVASDAAARACALRGGALNTDTNRCTVPEAIPEEEETPAASVRTCVFGSVLIDGVPNGETC